MCFPHQDDLSMSDYSIKCLQNLKGISIASLNICGLVSKLDDISHLLQQSNLDILVLTESHLSEKIDDSLLNIPGYTFYRQDRTAASGKRSGGGIITYFKIDRDVFLLNDHSSCSPHLECMWLRLELKLARPTYLCCLYRAPDSSYVDSINELELSLDSVNPGIRSDLVMLGDYNIDLNKVDSPTRSLNAFLKRQNLSQLITSNTRITNDSATLIDHIYVSNVDLYWHQGVVDPGLSDHALIYTMRKYKRISHEKETKYIRCYRNFDAVKFADDVGSTDWSAVYNATDINDAVSIFNFKMLSLIDKHLPWKKVRMRKYSAPWVSNEYLSFVDRREYFAKHYRKCPCEHHLSLKKTARRECNRLRDQLKREYLRKTLDKYRDNPKKNLEHHSRVLAG